MANGSAPGLNGEDGDEPSSLRMRPGRKMAEVTRCTLDRQPFQKAKKSVGVILRETCVEEHTGNGLHSSPVRCRRARPTPQYHTISRFPISPLRACPRAELPLPRQCEFLRATLPSILERDCGWRYLPFSPQSDTIVWRRLAIRHRTWGRRGYDGERQKWDASHGGLPYYYQMRAIRQT